jgi:branched-chain amino acid transport system substrate-binding protein
MTSFGKWALAAAMSVLTAGVSQAEIKVGFVTSLSGPGASIGIPYSKGMAAALAYASEVSGEKIRLIELDDASDPSASSRNTRKLIEEEKVDVVLGTSGAPSALAMATVAAELKVPMISLSPIAVPAVGPDGPWLVVIPQSADLMVAAVVEHMKAKSVKNVAFIGFSDAWGDLVFGGLNKAAGPAGITVTTNERYARADSSVTAQVLKMIATRPDGVMNGGAGTPGALPFLALAERGYKGPIFGSHALINADFIRVGGKAVEGVIAPTGPVVVAEQLPEANPTKKMALAFRAAYANANAGATTRDAFSAYSFDGWLVMLDAAKRVLPNTKPGTPEFRKAMRDALLSSKEVVGSHGIYNFSAEKLYGADERARVLVQLTGGEWKIVP